MAMEYFCCYHSYARKLARLSDQEVGRLFRALLTYSETGETQELTGRENVAFDFIADDIDRAKEKYEERCRRNSENATSGRERALATANERAQSHTNASDRTRPHTNASETSQNKKETKTKEKSKRPSIHQAEIKKQIDFDSLAAEYETERVEAITDLISEVYSMTGKTVNIGKSPYPVPAVQERFSKLEREHIEFVLDSLDHQQNPIRNPKGYLLASLYNAPATMIESWRNRANVDSG